ncbi:uncharacterized protein Z518_05219 [Rhinocladiella mackenziei CBS 650.93]|uniref:Zn(2)-C6 fungal-type domain-containing protein n=1 Tax=Rhinocladiella mackenziei CBS 650.93 TaxID=1442369 RepID=A0A0D2IMH4_9EURO|nr:uncharacterized protein Z518_05219 [Rhinocladiella mackenziei CBS 650.93]KIX04351.1 hypothetical protein Z518_05219 [Rhinocladiella mackenziei CBS 650.93]
MSMPQIDAQRGTAQTQADVNAPRKRRKRAPAAGATNDCFTCTTRQLKCDRRRPYCSQCLDDGKDCAGYKTQLTWGNGVASRGKLRGLSLPIAGTQKVATPSSPSKPKRKPSQSSQSSQSPHSLLQGNHNAIPDSRNVPAHLVPSPNSSNTGNVGPQFDQPQISFPLPPHYTTGAAWAPATATTLPATAGVESEPTEPSYSTISSISLTSPLESYPSGNRLNPNIGYGGSDRVSPMSHSTSSPESAYFGRVMSHGSTGVPSALPEYPVSPQFRSPHDNAIPDHGNFSFCQALGESYVRHDPYAQSYLSHHLDPSFEHGTEQAVDDDVEEVRRAECGEDDGCAVVETDSAVAFPQVSLHYNVRLSPLAGVGAIGATPRMQYLISYYTEVISPVIVAFDGPSNPYRTEILRLAARSETLQHAISALSASNLRQRRETGALSTGKTDPARRSSMAHLALTNESWHNIGLLCPQEQAREESRHKGIAIQSLNRQLANPVLRMDDSTLATLLILCLFHICDSGVARFQTQFAGVKKLLSLRKSDPASETKATKWFTRMFTWFDAMTATVNDREGQLQGYHLDVSALSDEEWALENLAGCDGQLFKTIARLGRLNVLSQGKPVKENPTIVSRPLPQMPAALNLDYNSFDGNGWMRIVEDENLFSSKTTDPDVKTQFWREWREIRHALQTWQLNTTLFDSSSPEAPYLTLEQRIDLANISESFRYSALLYTERLANPTVPSTDPCIRSWVQKCLMYIKAVKSDVYLLWPLFIAGSECVDEMDREVIRVRCLDIQKDSGFLNNKSCLELLEKVWLRNDEKKRGSARPGPGSQVDLEKESGFRFTTIMKSEKNDGEYIVV